MAQHQPQQRLPTPPFSPAHSPAEGVVTPSTSRPVLIIGAGISGLLLAQHLRAHSVPFRIFDRDADFATRGVGWGLTLHWSLPALRELLPEDLVRRIPSTYVDRAAVEAGETSRFPLYDLANGDLKFATPKATEATRIRVTREKLRQLLAEGLEVEWAKGFAGFTEQRTSESDDGDRIVRVSFDDGSEALGSLVVGCDGGNSRVRRALFPDRHQNWRLPVRVMGFKADYSPEEVASMKKLDPFFLQATSSQNNTFMYFSILEAPGNHTRELQDSTEPSAAAPEARTGTSSDARTGLNGQDKNVYQCQVVVSWPYRDDFRLDTASEPGYLDFPPTTEGKAALVETLAKTWAEPFRSIVSEGVARGDDLKQLELSDYVPAKELKSTGRVVLLGDAIHSMTMYRGEGANHAVVDVLDFAARVTPHLMEVDSAHESGKPAQRKQLREALDDFEESLVQRTRPAVLAARRACMDAHDWPRITSSSPLLTRREVHMRYDEDESAFE